MPLRAASVDVVLLLDVLEHLHNPEQALSEIHRVLAPGGKLILQVPFLYPVHDAPRDYTRWSLHGHRSVAARIGFCAQEECSQGAPLETAALLVNIALSDAALDGLRRGRLTALLILPLPILVLAINLSAWLFTTLGARGDFMALSYRAIWTKPHPSIRAAG